MKSYTVNIYIGLRAGYGDLHFTTQDVKNICQNFVDKVGLCVTVTPTSFIYKNGSEDGAIVGLINYPRFPKDEIDIKNTAIKLAEILKDKLSQNRISIVCTDETIMIGDYE